MTMNITTIMNILNGGEPGAGAGKYVHIPHASRVKRQSQIIRVIISMCPKKTARVRSGFEPVTLPLINGNA